MAAASVQGFHCGEVFITTNFCMILECKSCNEQFGVYTTFLDHIFEKHFDDWSALEKSKRKQSKKVVAATEREDIELSTIDQDVDINSTTLKEISLEDCEQDYETDVMGPAHNDAAIIEVNIIHQKETTPKSTKPSVRQLRTCVTSNNSTAADSKRKYKCRICGFAVSGSHNLRGHEQRHSNVKPFTCLKCDKAFYTRTELNTHTRRHNGEKPFICAYCGRSFITAGMLTMHERRHLGQRQYKCSQCEKSFFEASHLRNHTVVHSKERNFECETCQAKFSRKVTLQTHMKLHENALRYECVICNMRFNQRPTMLWHVKSKHNVIQAGGESKDFEQASTPTGETYENI